MGEVNRGVMAVWWNEAEENSSCFLQPLSPCWQHCEIGPILCLYICTCMCVSVCVRVCISVPSHLFWSFFFQKERKTFVYFSLFVLRIYSAQGIEWKRPTCRKDRDNTRELVLQSEKGRVFWEIGNILSVSSFPFPPSSDWNPIGPVVSGALLEPEAHPALLLMRTSRSLNLNVSFCW